MYQKLAWMRLEMPMSDRFNSCCASPNDCKRLSTRKLAHLRRRIARRYRFKSQPAFNPAIGFSDGGVIAGQSFRAKAQQRRPLC
jgi:hypothetical protein